MGIIANKTETNIDTKTFKLTSKSQKKEEIQLGWAREFVKIEDDAFSQLEIVDAKLEKAPKSL